MTSTTANPSVVGGAATPTSPASIRTPRTASTVIQMAPPVIKPLTAPKMGAVLDNGTPDATPWTGGKPKPDWSGLEDPSTDMESPNCMRPTKASERAKNYNIRVTEPKLLFKKNDDEYDFNDFTKVVHQHLVSTGMDTVLYFPSLSNPGEMVDIIMHHDQVTLKHVMAESVKRLPSFDAYDKDNDKSARLTRHSTKSWIFAR